MLIKCEECEKQVSEYAHICPSCGFTINKPKRSFSGVIFYYLFFAFNAIMIVLILTNVFKIFISGDYGFISMFSLILLFITWLSIGLPLALMSYLTRPKLN